MCRFLLLLLVVPVMMLSCTKSSTSASPSYDAASDVFRGTYVKVDSRADTLVVSATNGKPSLFFNSKAYRDNITAPAHPELQTFEYEFKDGKIGVRSINSQISSFVYYDFSWVVTGKTFRIQAMAIQPDLNASTTFCTFEKIQ
ncbi:hypothetical protein [Pinibacter aurantiacus]|uniref:Lipocalin-like domain-containing protein n=1 Tax=Pinibacter aurantiacus TaxID=2851599 RepID=A0A9E2S8U9_9BACT|nr:hypothetical protein [Pinibacter aurantiacus]MBV4356819.1 hypothetical protein [Pinibacter aurantiacus]